MENIVYENPVDIDMELLAVSVYHSTTYGKCLAFHNVRLQCSDNGVGVQFHLKIVSLKSGK